MCNPDERVTVNDGEPRELVARSRQSVEVRLANVRNAGRDVELEYTC
jgi:hypothetical protein